MQDFDTPKALVNYEIDTDNPNFMVDMQHTALRYEDRMKIRASIIIDAYATQLAEIDEDKLTSKDRELFERVVKLLNFLQDVKVVDAPVLLKIYDLHRCKL